MKQAKRIIVSTVWVSSICRDRSMKPSRSICFSFLFLAWGATKAQDLYNSTGLYVIGGALHVPGNIQNEGYLQNNGTVTLEGNWTNENTYNGTGKIELKGERAQYVLNHDQSIASLQVNGPGEKWIGDSLFLTQNLTLENGVIHFYNAGKLQLAHRATIDGGSRGSYIHGPLTHEGSGYKFYPVGKNNRYRPLELLDIHGIEPATSIELMEHAPPLRVTSCDEVFGELYWQRRTVAGTFESSPISLVYDDGDVTSYERLVIIQAESFEHDFTPLETEVIAGNERSGKVASGSGASGTIFLLASRQRPSVQEEPAYYFSNILSPSAANPANRSIKVFGDFLTGESFHFIIFNRLGLVVFETRSLDVMRQTGWNGESNGAALPSGAYPYAFHAVTRSGESKDLKGIISIVR